MLVKIEARILIFPGTDFHFPSTSVPPGTFFRLCSNVDFFTARHYASAVFAVIVSACLPVRQKPVLHQNDWTNRTGFGTDASFHLSHTVLQRNVSPKIRVLSSATFCPKLGT